MKWSLFKTLAEDLKVLHIHIYECSLSDIYISSLHIYCFRIKQLDNVFSLVFTVILWQMEWPQAQEKLVL